MKERKYLSVILIITTILVGCDNKPVNEYKENTPTSGKLKVYYDEGLRAHVRNQVRTFESQYERAKVQIHEVSESEAIEALYRDSCESIFIARNLNEKEQRAFAGIKHQTHFTIVAKTGVAVIANAASALKVLSYEQIIDLLKSGKSPADSTGKVSELQVLFDKNNSGVLHYMLDSVLHSSALSSNCSILNASTESINYVSTHPNAIAFIDFSWLSDVDDSLNKANAGKIKFLALGKKGGKTYEYPSQSSFKLCTYPFIRNIHVIRKTGDFTLAKGFESFVAGPKGQLTFLKQGLLPARQAERRIEVKLDPAGQIENE